MIRNVSSIFIAVMIMLGCCRKATGIEKSAAPPTVTGSQPVSGDATPWRRDPFIVKVKNTSTAKSMPLKIGDGPLKQEEDIQLQGIMQADRAFHALINGRVVKTGDTIGGTVIKHISRYQVVVQNVSKEKVIYDIYQGRIDRGKK